MYIIYVQSKLPFAETVLSPSSKPEHLKNTLTTFVLIIHILKTVLLFSILIRALSSCKQNSTYYRIAITESESSFSSS